MKFRFPFTPSSSTAGHALFKLIVLMLVVLALMGALYLALMSASHAVTCVGNLKRIYNALEVYEMSHGALPRLNYYPEEAMGTAGSICVVLESYGLDPRTWICPATHPIIRETGLSYLWNTRLNGASLRELTERQWMMVEINAASPGMPGPHFGYCNVLFTDGTVERVRNPAREIAGW